MDNKGRITVVLHWDQRSQKVEKLLNALQIDTSKSKKPQSILKDKSTSFETPELVMRKEQQSGRMLETHNNHQPYASFDSMRPPAAFFKEPQFSRFLKAGSFENANLHRHTIECVSGPHNVVDIRPGSPHRNGECDFHCCVLHEEGRKIAVTRNVATSPIHQGSGVSIADGPKKSSKNVRFLDVEEQRSIGASEDENDNQSNSSETDTDTTTTLTEEEGVTEKFLLLVDEQKRHLSIKDIGVILERLSSKIIDVERLDRENENNDCRNWTIKATIRGDGLEELGLIYAGRYYEISEHPGYKDGTDNFNEEKSITQNVEARV